MPVDFAHERCRRNLESVYGRFIDGHVAVFGDETNGACDTGNLELAGNPHVERCVKDARDFGGDKDASAGNSDDDEIFMADPRREGFGQPDTGFCPILVQKFYAAALGMHGHGRDRFDRASVCRRWSVVPAAVHSGTATALGPVIHRWGWGTGSHITSIHKQELFQNDRIHYQGPRVCVFESGPETGCFSATDDASVIQRLRDPTWSLSFRAVSQNVGPDAAPLSVRTRPGVAAILRNGCIFFAAGVLGCLLLGRVMPFPDLPTLGPKYRYFAAHRDEFDVLFLGSSRFFHQIIPKQFDNAVEAATGEQFHSFNISCDALWPPESYYFLRKVFELHPKNLKWVFIELMDIDPRLDSRNRDTRRQSYWHDLQHTRMAFEALDSTKLLTPKEAGDMKKDHAWLLLKTWTNVGRGAELCNDLLASHNVDDRGDRSEEWIPSAGYRGGDENGLSGSELADFQGRLKRMKKDLDPIAMTPVFSRESAEIAKETRALNAKPVFVIAPTVNFLENYSPTPEGVPVLAYNDPTKYPALYDPAIHYDSWHLNPKGAVVFTGIFARDFSTYLQGIVKKGSANQLPAGGARTESKSSNAK